MMVIMEVMPKAVVAMNTLTNRCFQGGATIQMTNMIHTVMIEVMVNILQTLRILNIIERLPLVIMGKLMNK